MIDNSGNCHYILTMNTQTKNSTQIQKLANTIMASYKIKPNAHVSSNKYVVKQTYQEAIEDWIQASLLNLDEKLADCLLPILIDRFEDYLSDRKLT